MTTTKTKEKTKYFIPTDATRVESILKRVERGMEEVKSKKLCMYHLDGKKHLRAYIVDKEGNTLFDGSIKLPAGLGKGLAQQPEEIANRDMTFNRAAVQRLEIEGTEIKDEVTFQVNEFKTEEETGYVIRFFDGDGNLLGMIVIVKDASIV